jgi:hypothetical protein
MKTKKITYSKNEKIAFDKGYRVTPEGKLLNPKNKEIGSYDKQGYKKFTLQIDKKCLMIYAHRLQAYQIYGDEIYKEGMHCRHLDSNKANNCIDNICLGTAKENFNDRNRDDVMKVVLYASSFTKKHDYKKIKEYYNKTKSYKMTKEKFGITSSGTLHYILKNDEQAKKIIRSSSN